MKVRIWYEYLPQYEHKYWAKAKLFDNSYLCRCGDNWEDAKKDMMEKLKELEEMALHTPEIPADEVVELNIPEPEVAHVSR